jgi:hypothetical protein
MNQAFQSKSCCVDYCFASQADYNERQEPPVAGAAMKDLTSHPTETGAPSRSFNYNKLQAVACIASSAAVSITLIYWAIQSLF